MTPVPHDERSEAAVLGAVLLSERPLKRLVVDIGLTGEAFHQAKYGRVWEAMVALAMKGDPVDAVTLRAQLGDEFTAMLDELPALVPMAANVVGYAKRVIELAEWRQVLKASFELQEAVATQSADGRHTAEGLLNQAKRHTGDTRSPEMLAEDVWRHLEGHQIPAWKTPWPSLNDAMGGGLRAGEVTLLGGWTSMGKALDIATPIATPDGFRAMLHLRVGDRVFDERGCATRITAVTAVQFGRPCMEVIFSDGERIVADEEHEWLTWTDAARRSEASASVDQQHKRVRPSIVTTAEMAQTLVASRRRGNNHSIPFWERPSRHRYVTAIHRIGTRPVKCIEVDSPSRLYLAGWGCVPTHNSLAVDNVLRWCGDQGARVHLYINEMAPTMRALRNVAALTGVPQHDLAQPKRLSEKNLSTITAAIGKGMPFGITQVTDWTAAEVARDIRFRGWDVCALDLLHRLPYREERDLAEISSMLNAAAQASGSHLIAVVHLNEMRATTAKLPPPVLRDIRGSGMLKNDADNVMFVHRTEQEDEAGTPKKTDEASVYLQKCRNGRLAGVPLLLDAAHGRFLETADADRYGV